MNDKEKENLEMTKLARFLYHLYKNNKELVGCVLEEEKEK